MNTDIFWRLVWKEYRQQRALWVAIALGGLIFQAAALIFCLLNGLSDVSDKLFTIALSFPILYSLGCGAALFAGEHEAETFSFQQSLPVAAGRVFLAKLAFAMLSALLLFPVLWLLAFAMASWTLPDTSWHLQLWGGGVVATIEVLIWATLGSLVLRRVLPAAIVSGLIAVLLGYSSLVLVKLFGNFFQQQVENYFWTLPLRSSFALVALGVAITLGRRWFAEQAIRWRSPSKQLVRSDISTRQPRPATGVGVFTRLVWHEWRQARVTLTLCVIGYFLLGGWLVAMDAELEVFVGLIPPLAAVLGGITFGADQRKEQYQFFTEHGVRPRLVWFSRQLVWLFALLVPAGLVIGIQYIAPPLQVYELSNLRLMIWACLGFAGIAFAVGQLASILIRSAVVALFVSLLSAALLCVWSAYTVAFGVPWYISALPLALAFIWASWLYAPKWIQQRRTWRVRIITAATIVVPLLGVVAATAAYRVYEIPAIKLSVDPSNLANNDNTEARETAAMYQEADQMLRQRLSANSSDGSKSLSAHDALWREGIDLFVAASERQTCYFADAFDWLQLHRAVLAEARTRAEAGDLEGAAELHDSLLRLVVHFYQQNDEASSNSYGAALEQQVFMELPIWANHQSLTAERVQQTLADLETWCETNRPDSEASIMVRRQLVHQLIAMDGASVNRWSATERASLKALVTLLPWERWRAARLCDVCTEADLQGIRYIRNSSLRFPPQALASMKWDVRLDLGNGSQQLIRSTDVEVWLTKTPWLQLIESLMATSYALSEQGYQAPRGAVQVQLALIAWQKEHGVLPDSLQELTGHPFGTLPTDPYTGQPFVYMPNGVVEGIGERFELGGAQNLNALLESDDSSIGNLQIARTEPFLWSPGPLLLFSPAASRRQNSSPTASEFRDQQRNRLTEQALLHQGQRYPIPVAKQQPSDASGDADALPIDE